MGTSAHTIQPEYIQQVHDRVTTGGMKCHQARRLKLADDPLWFSFSRYRLRQAAGDCARKSMRPRATP